MCVFLLVYAHGGEKMGEKTRKKTGRPFAIKSREDLQEKIDKYFADCESKPIVIDGKIMLDKNGFPVYDGGRPLTMSGLAYSLGIDRTTLINYGKSEDYGDIVSRAKNRVEQYMEERLFDKDGANGAKFALSNNYSGWADRQDIKTDNSTKIEIVLPETVDEYAN